MRRGRRIAFDYGDVRIGVAVSDLDSILSSPLCNLRSNDKKLILEIKEILSEIDPIVIYIGRPKLLRGSDGDSTRKVLEFAELLKSITQVPIEFVDERLSTITAARSLRNAGKNAKQSKEIIDMTAAIAILDFAIELERSK